MGVGILIFKHDNDAPLGNHDRDSRAAESFRRRAGLLLKSVCANKYVLLWSGQVGVAKETWRGTLYKLNLRKP